MNPGDSELRERAAFFAREGYLVLPGFASAALCDDVAAEVRASLDPVLAPAEFEADLGYPGAPRSRDARGGDTPRRLLNAYSRFSALRPLVTGPEIGRYLRALIGAESIGLSQCHHNCVMTKSPGFSSVTLWHQDIRYWAFERPELVSLWLALGSEQIENGALQVIPGSHRMSLERARLDDRDFLVDGHPDNQRLIDTARPVPLEQGDALLFHCRTFHAAGRNVTDRVKLSCVFTYHATDNVPVAGTRSAQYASIDVRVSTLEHRPGVDAR